VLLEVVADKTGYPVDMLELDMSLDADLGIDSIKRVEILSAFQDKAPEAPPVKPEDLGTLQTLRQIVEFVDAAATNSVASTQHADEPQTAVSHPPQDTADHTDSSTIQSALRSMDLILLEVVADKTGYPVDMLELDIDRKSVV